MIVETRQPELGVRDLSTRYLKLLAHYVYRVFYRILPSILVPVFARLCNLVRLCSIPLASSTYSAGGLPVFGRTPVPGALTYSLYLYLSHISYIEH
jgi:hypothetical protein